MLGDRLCPPIDILFTWSLYLGSELFQNSNTFVTRSWNNSAISHPGYGCVSVLQVSKFLVQCVFLMARTIHVVIKKGSVGNGMGKKQPQMLGGFVNQRLQQRA